MPDINRRPYAASIHFVHDHVCPNCHRHYSCNCNYRADGTSMVCIDCETATYNPVIHGGTGEKEEA